MWNFLVLGIIPGTHIQINFKLWLVVLAGSLLVFVLLRMLLRTVHRHTQLPLPSISMEAH